jgi:hypothetical protein
MRREKTLDVIPGDLFEFIVLRIGVRVKGQRQKERRKKNNYPHVCKS